MFSFLLLRVNQNIQPPSIIPCIRYPSFQNLSGILNSLFSDSSRPELELRISRSLEHLLPKRSILALDLHHENNIPHQRP